MMLFISSTTISYALLLWTTISSTSTKSTTTTEAWMISPSLQSRRSIVSNSFFHKRQQKQQTKTSSSSYRKQKNHVILAAVTSATDDDDDGDDDFPTLNFFNSLTKRKEPLKSLKRGKISMYTCGPTVYDFAHVGNFRAFLTYDLIKRALLYFGYDVDHVCNLTDVDDKIINRANELSIDKITDLTLKYETLFMEDLEALNVIKANKYPRATEHIEEMMDMILALESKDLAYEADDGSWYFNTANQDGYGTKLVNLNVDEMETTERGENESKRNSQDFVLWKTYKPGIDRDDAVWSSSDNKIQKGRPGWHLECSAMSRKYLGDTIDIHGGGIDLKFPHHENEIAQSEGVTGCTFCNCWMHNGFVNINDEKMSKSLGNFLTLKTACTTSLDIRAYRYLVVSSQYRNPLSFTPDVMMAAKKSLKRIDTVKNNINMALSEKNKDDDDDDTDDTDGATTTTTMMINQNDISKAMNNFEAALKDDLSMPRAAASLFNLIKLAEKEFKRVAKEDSNEAKLLDIVGLQSIDDAIQKMDQVFGIFYEVPLTAAEEEEAAANAASDDDDDDEVPEEVIQLVVQRTEAKEAKDWELADSLRSRITELGFSVKDVKGGEPIVSRVE